MTENAHDLANQRPVITWRHTYGDLLDQDVDALVNPWNRNFLPRWSLLVRGVSGQLKKRTGPEPWRALAARGLMPLGAAFVTRGGRLDCDLIHVAGLNMLWRATTESVVAATRNAIAAAWEHEYASIAMPLIGAGSGGLAPDRARTAITSVLDQNLAAPEAAQVLDVTVVEWNGAS